MGRRQNEDKHQVFYLIFTVVSCFVFHDTQTFLTFDSSGPKQCVLLKQVSQCLLVKKMFFYVFVTENEA